MALHGIKTPKRTSHGSHRTGFVGKDEKLTDAEKRLLKAAGHKLGTIPRGKGPLVLKKDKADTGQEGTRTRAALAKAVAKLTRLRSAVDTSKPVSKAKPKAKGKTGSDAARIRKEKDNVEKALNVRRGS